MKLITPFVALTDRACRALLVIGLATLARLMTSASVRLYARGWLSAVEVRFLLGFSSTLHRTTIRLAGRQ
ncbi:MAG: hypothetical protein NTV76_17800 [Pseudomonas sp.]|nr:hypothetical protein [Pseudomonas sp.]